MTFPGPTTSMRPPQTPPLMTPTITGQTLNVPGPARPAGAASVVTAPMSPQSQAAWGRMRRGVDAVRSTTGRLATLAGAAAALAVVADPTGATTALAVGGTAAVALAGLGTLRLQMPVAGHQKATASTLYLMPGIALGAVQIAVWATAGASWGGTVPVQVAGALVWTAGVWWVRPARIARTMACPPPPPAPAADHVLANVVDGHPAARWWATRAAIEGGVAPGTVLQDVVQTGQAAMAATICATAFGEPVPTISITRLSALMDVPEDQIHITGVPGRGTGVRRLTVGVPDPAHTAADLATVWETDIAPHAMPGAVLTSVRVGRPGDRPTDLPTHHQPHPDTAEADAESGPRVVHDLANSIFEPDPDRPEDL